ncbi:hypothetical protein C8R44DRAFT_862029 [Mycena epipterygia]|nr:hypothetical protein C8R44DRAFT_862029 [Mycena epipterygia]
MQSHQYSLPLTPPPTGRIPLLAQLPDPGKPQNIYLAVISSHDLPSVPQTTGFFPPIQTNSLVSPAAVRNFQRVIDEMKGVDPGHQANDLTYDFVSSLPSYLSTPVKEFVIPEDTRDGGSPPSNAPLAMDRTLGTLEDEFVALLQQRAIEEEADAKELRVLASRLERVGNGRRHLAALIQERKIGQSEARMQVR